MPDLPWGDVEPLPEVNGDLRTSVLASVESLRDAWKTVVSSNDPAFQEARRRSLRRHAIETGIIERLYDVGWGVTEALVAEGITADAVARSGDGAVSENVLELIRSQYDALEFMAQAARAGRELSISLIKELHVALTRRQPTYEATGPTGLVFQATLHHGEWKREDNHVRRPDGSLLQYTPADHVGPQMDRLVELHRSYADENPIVRAAWLHHRFVRIHPFEDGNGRVARCLTLLELLRADLAPVVVDRRERDRYLECLDKANDGDLRPLVRFFAELEIVALRSELERPVEPERAALEGGALAVLKAGVGRLRQLRLEAGAEERAEKVAKLASAIHARLEDWLGETASKARVLLQEVDPYAHVSTQGAAPPQEQSRYWRRQVIKTAQSVDFFVNLRGGVWWQRLRVSALGQELRYLVFLQKVGHGETGVLTLTVYAEIKDAPGRRPESRRPEDEDSKIVVEEDNRPEPEPLFMSAPTDSVTWTYQDEPDRHWQDVVELLDRTLAASLLEFTSGLG